MDVWNILLPISYPIHIQQSLDEFFTSLLNKLFVFFAILFTKRCELNWTFKARFRVWSSFFLKTRSFSYIFISHQFTFYTVILSNITSGFRSSQINTTDLIYDAQKAHQSLIIISLCFLLSRKIWSSQDYRVAESLDRTQNDGHLAYCLNIPILKTARW